MGQNKIIENQNQQLIHMQDLTLSVDTVIQLYVRGLQPRGPGVVGRHHGTDGHTLLHADMLHVTRVAEI